MSDGSLNYSLSVTDQGGSLTEAVRSLADMEDELAALVSRAKTMDVMSDEFRRATSAADRLQAEIQGINAQSKAMASASAGGAGATRNFGQAALEGSRAFEDLQYGIGGVINNIPGLLMSLGAGAGMTGIVSILVVLAAKLGPKLVALFRDPKPESLAFNQAVRDVMQSLGDMSDLVETLADQEKQFAAALQFGTDAADRQETHLTRLAKSREALANAVRDQAKAEIEAQEAAGKITAKQAEQAKFGLDFGTEKGLSDARTRDAELVAQSREQARLAAAKAFGEQQAKASQVSRENNATLTTPGAVTKQIDPSVLSGVSDAQKALQALAAKGLDDDSEEYQTAEKKLEEALKKQSDARKEIRDRLIAEIESEKAKVETAGKALESSSKAASDAANEAKTLKETSAMKERTMALQHQAKLAKLDETEAARKSKEEEQRAKATEDAQKKLADYARTRSIERAKREQEDAKKLADAKAKDGPDRGFDREQSQARRFERMAKQDKDKFRDVGDFKRQDNSGLDRLKRLQDNKGNRDGQFGGLDRLRDLQNVGKKAGQVIAAKPEPPKPEPLGNKIDTLQTVMRTVAENTEALKKLGAA